MTYHVILGICAAFFGLIAIVPYIKSILIGDTKPHRTTFGVWCILGTIQVTSYFASGARTTILLPTIYLLSEYVIFFLSLKRGMGGASKLDVTCLFGALLAIVSWVITKNPHNALYLSIAASLLGFIPTIKKTYLFPHTENSLSWGLDVIAATCNLLALEHFKLYLVLYPIYAFTTDATISALTLLPKLRKRIST